MSKLTILRDNQEKKGWNFASFDCDVKVVNLNTGDYTIEGFENDLCIERKASTGEIAINLGICRKAFEAEFDRMLTFKHRYLICEFPVNHFWCFPEKSKIPKNVWHKIRMNGKYLYKAITELCEKHNVTLIFCDSPEDAEKKCMDIISSVTGIDYEESW